MKIFNNSDLFTGYLKQLLHSFNLPKIKVYTAQHEKYFNEHGQESPEILSTIEATPDDKRRTKYTDADLESLRKNTRYFPYIKDGEIQVHVDGKWQNIRTNDIKPVALYRYTYGDKLLNYTKTLKITSNTYDSYTHEYLGDYLRFQRDYLGLNLMSLYNCFSNRACDKLDFQWTIGGGETATSVSFNSADPNFKIYMIPVKLFQKYTIAIDSTVPIEMCCGVYGDYQDNRSKFATLPINTYKKLSNSSFSQPFLYDMLAADLESTTAKYIDYLLDSRSADGSTLIELAQNECDLKLFLKIPVTNNSTIVVLEGDYRNWNDSLWDMTRTAGKNGGVKNYQDRIETIDKEGKLQVKQLNELVSGNKKCNKSIINLTYNFKRHPELPLISPLQLLQFNTQEQHPFSDRLIEYLIDNAITNSDTEIYDNVARAQKALGSNSGANGYLRGLPGVWSKEMNVLFYEYMMSNAVTTSFDINRDLLGYVDKDVEKFYQATGKAAGNTAGRVSLSNIELEEGDK